MKMYRHLDDQPNTLCKTEFFSRTKWIFASRNKLIGCSVTLFAGLFIGLCCYSLSKCIFNRWQLLKDQLFWTAIVMTGWLSLLNSLGTSSANKFALNTKIDAMTHKFALFLNQLLKVRKTMGINKNTK